MLRENIRQRPGVDPRKRQVRPETIDDQRTNGEPEALLELLGLCESAEADDGNDRSVPPASLVEAGDFAAACLGAALRLIVKAVAAYKQSAAFYELFEPIAVALVGLTPSSTSGEEVDEEEEEEKPKKKKQKKKQPPPPKKKKKKAPASKARPFAAGSPLGALFEEARGAVTEGVERCLKHRVPMQWQSTTVADEALESLAPKYEARYDGTQKAQRGSAAQADAAEEKKLLKALKREQKGAARELRRDAEYLARARDDERDRVSGAKQEERHKNFAWLQDQQASLNQQVRKGGAMVTGGGSSIGSSTPCAGTHSQSRTREPRPSCVTQAVGSSMRSSASRRSYSS